LEENYNFKMKKHTKIVITKLKAKTYSINCWPDTDTVFKLGFLAKQEELKDLIIDNDSSYYPTAEEHYRVRDLSKLGLTIHGLNILKGRELLYYNGLFLDPQLLTRFKKSEELDFQAAVYISAMELNQKEQGAVRNAIKGYSIFTNSQGMICTGGGGGGMRFVNQVAKENNLISVGVCWNDNLEPQNPYLDAVSRFANKDIFARQDYIDKFAKVVIAGPGGFGTDLELGIANVNIKLEMYSKRPIILICKESYQKYIARLRDIIHRNKAGETGDRILSNTYLSENGEDVDEILLKHFKKN
jgi:predicted Rossmann-fold nucleotide-binding protein